MKERDTVKQLRKLNWFEGLSEEMLFSLAQKVRKHNLQPGEILFHKGDEGKSLFFILSGWMKIFTLDKNGVEVALNQVGPGEIIGEMALLDYEPRSASVVALEETYILELCRDEFMEILKEKPDLALSVIRNLSSRLRHNTSYIEKITDMSRRVAQGDYSFIGETRPLKKRGKNAAGQDKIEQLLSEFFVMVHGVREREENLKKQVQKLRLEIDEARRKQEFKEITSTDFYARLKSQAQELRKQRTDKK